MRSLAQIQVGPRYENPDIVRVFARPGHERPAPPFLWSTRGLGSRRDPVLFRSRSQQSGNRTGEAIERSGTIVRSLPTDPRLLDLLRHSSDVGIDVVGPLDRIHVILLPLLPGHRVSRSLRQLLNRAVKEASRHRSEASNDCQDGDLEKRIRCCRMGPRRESPDTSRALAHGGAIERIRLCANTSPRASRLNHRGQGGAAGRYVHDQERIRGDAGSSSSSTARIAGHDDPVDALRRPEV